MNTFRSRLVRWVPQLLLCVTFAWPAAGCLSAKRVEPLGDAVRQYNQAVRWERFEMAAARLPAKQRDDFLDRRDQLSDELRISHIEVVRVRHDKTGRRANVQVKYTWHLDSRGVVHTTHTVQRWERPSSSWQVLAERHLRGEPLPHIAVDEDEGEAAAVEDLEPAEPSDSDVQGSLRDPTR